MISRAAAAFSSGIFTLPAWAVSSQRVPATSPILQDGLLAVAGGRERADRLVPLLLGGDRDDLALGVAQGGQGTAEYHAGV